MASIYEDWETYTRTAGITPNPFQQEAIYELLRLPKLANLTWTRDSGKTWAMGNLAFFFMYRYGWDIVVAAPVLGQSSHIMNEAGRAAYRICKQSKVHASSATVRIKGRPGKIVSVTGSVNAHKQGAKGHIVIIDEKHDVSGVQAAEDFIGMKVRGGCLWLVGVGGSPDSAGEMFKDDNAYVSVLPWEEYSTYDTDYIEEKVEPARRLMIPEEFAAHYECKPLDINTHLLVPSIEAYTPNTTWGKAQTIVGIDWGKRLDQTVATVIDITPEASYIKEWLIPTGSYDEQMTELVGWLKHSIEYDHVIAETNGVGDGCADFLMRAMKDPKGFTSGVQGLQIGQAWITDQAKRVNRMASNHSLLYNPDHQLSGPFVKDITQVEYKMLDSRHIKLPSSGQRGHSDFLSSLLLALHEPGVAYL